MRTPTLGTELENLGEIDSAKFQYQIALEERKNYPYAYAGLAMIEKQNGNYKKSIYNSLERSERYKRTGN